MKMLQKAIASMVAAPERADWYVEKGYGTAEHSLEERFDLFVQAKQLMGTDDFEIFHGMDFQRQELDVTLSNQSSCKTEVVSLGLTPECIDERLPGMGKHVVYFTGMGSKYQNCFKDMATAVKTTGAQYHGFEYPGMKALGGEVLEANDLVNTGIAVVNSLLNKGISIDDIILQGDSFGSAVAYKVKQQFFAQSGVQVRVIMNNGFDTFQDGVRGYIGDDWYSTPIRAAVGPYLKYTGWDARPGDTYITDTAYQIHVNHIGDLTLADSTLGLKVIKNEDSLDFVDICEEEFKASRDALKAYRWAEMTPAGQEALIQKYGVTKDGRPDTHLADLSSMGYPETSETVYEGLIVKYLASSNTYIKNHPQEIDINNLPKPLLSEVQPFTSCLYSFFSDSSGPVEPKQDYVKKSSSDYDYFDFMF